MSLDSRQLLYDEAISHAEEMSLSEFWEILGTISTAGTYDFGGKKYGPPKKKNCTAGKSHFCRRPTGTGTCLPLSKKCRFQPDATAQATSKYVANKAKAQKPSPKTETIDDLKKAYKPYAPPFQMSNLGNLMHIYADEISTKGKPDSSLVKEFGQGNRNWAPIIIAQTGNDQYEAIGSGSQKIAASAQASGKNGRAFSVIVPNDPKHIAVAKKLQVPDSKPIPMSKNKDGGFGSELGNLKHTYADEIVGSKTKGHGASDKQVDEAARLLLKNNSRNWVPVLVRGNGKGGYDVVGNHFAYDVAKRAGIDRMWTVEVP